MEESRGSLPDCVTQAGIPVRSTQEKVKVKSRILKSVRDFCFEPQRLEDTEKHSFFCHEKPGEFNRITFTIIFIP